MYRDKKVSINTLATIAGILLDGFGIGLLVQIHWGIVAGNYFPPGVPFVFGFFGGALIASGLALILWGNRGSRGRP